MAQLLFKILLTCMMLPSSHLVNDWKADLVSRSTRCDTYFCKGILIKPELEPNCSHVVMGDSDKCVCYGKLNTNPTAVNSCDYFVEKLPVVVYSDWNTVPTRPKLSTKLTVVKPETFYPYMDKFLRYLSLTNITDFDFTLRRPYSSSLFYEAVCDYDFSLSTPILNLSGYYTENRVERFTMTGSCIYGIAGQFSSVFPDLLELKLNDNILRVFNSSLLVGLNKIEKIDLNHNILTDFENDLVFQGLSSVTYLDLSRNNLMNLNAGLLSPLVNLQVLNLSENVNLSLHPDIVRQNTEIRVLELSGCLMNNTMLEKGIFKGLHKLEFISLDLNMFSELPFDAFPSLKYLTLSRNRLTNFSAVVKLFSNLTTLEMSENCLDNSSLSLPATKIIQDFECRFCCLDNWGAGQVAQWVTSTIDFKENKVNTLDMNILKNLIHLKTVYLSNNNEKLQIRIDLSYPLYTNSSLGQPDTQLFLSNYNFEVCEFVTLMLVSLNITQHPDVRMVRSDVSFIITDFTIAHRFFQNTREVLNDLEMSNAICSFTFYCPDNCECTTEGFNEIITVNCRGKELTAFPNTDAFHTPIILDLSNNDIHRVENPLSTTWTILSALNLNNNSLESINDFGSSPYLQTLDLRNNRLKQFPSPNQLSLQDGNPQLHLLLSHNPWQCDCDIDEKTKNLLEAVAFIDFVEFWCTSIHTGRLLYLVNTTKTEVCPIPESDQLLLKILLPVLVSFLACITVAVIVYYRHKEYIKFWLFSRGLCLRFVTEEDIDEDKIYDAFVSYSSLDEDWVSCNLVPGLENELPSYKLCLHDRDWPAGEWIIEQIFASVKQSRRTIIVLTENFVDSVWSQMEFMAAYKQSISDQVNRVLVVVPGKIPEDSRLSPELKSFVTLNTYIQYENPYFWRKLRSAMPRVKQPHAKPHNQEEIVTVSSSA